MPDFTYTLLSVKQLWREQGRRSVFDDTDHLLLTKLGGEIIPFNPKSNLPVISLISSSQLANASGKGATKSSITTSHSALVGFHSTKSVSHNAKMSAEQAGELMHRRNHSSLAKNRAAPHISSDAPRNLSSSDHLRTANTCVHCVSAQMRRRPCTLAIFIRLLSVRPTYFSTKAHLEVVNGPIP